jgi:hypothetical protein
VPLPNLSRRSLALFAGALFVSFAVDSLSAAAPRPVVIRNVTLIDGRSAAAKPEMTVIISNRHFTMIAPAAQTKVPPDAEIIDALENSRSPGSGTCTFISPW